MSPGYERDARLYCHYLPARKRRWETLQEARLGKMRFLASNNWVACNDKNVSIPATVFFGGDRASVSVTPVLAVTQRHNKPFDRGFKRIPQALVSRVCRLEIFWDGPCALQEAALSLARCMSTVIFGLRNLE